MTVMAGVLAREEEVVHLEVREMGEQAKLGDSEAAAVAVTWATAAAAARTAACRALPRLVPRRLRW